MDDLSEDDLARDWSLTPDDLALVATCRGPDHRRRFALQLCMLRAHGRFLDDYRQAPIKIINHLSHQLALPPVLALDRSDRGQTERAQAQRIRRHLGLSRFDKATDSKLREALHAGALEGRGGDELLIQAETILRGWQVMLPAINTLERIVISVVATTTADLFTSIAARLPEALRASIDLLVEMPAGDARSSLFRLRDYPKSANASVIKGDIVRLGLIEDLLAAGTGLDDLDPRIVRQIGELGRRYDAGDLRRFAKPKRDALVACYLTGARKTLLDQIVEMHDLFLIDMNRRAHHAVEKKRQALQGPADAAVDRMAGTVEALVTADGAQSVSDFRETQDPPALVEASTSYRAKERLEQRGHLDAMLARYANLRQYLPAFLSLPFQAAPGSESLLKAIEICRGLDAGTRDTLTADDPHHFVQAHWRAHLTTSGKSGEILDRGIWEISLAFAVRDALRAGSLFLTQSRHHVSFWNLIYENRNWQQAREQAYQRLDLPIDGPTFLTKIIAEFERAAQAAERGLPTNRFATIKDGRLKLKKRDAMPVSRALRALRDLIGASMPKARIEDLLQDVDEWCHFTTAFQPLSGYQPRNPDPYLSLLATLIAHGTNLGLAAMSQSVDTLTADALQDTSRWFLRDATLKAANTILVNHHHGRALSAI